MVQNLELFSSSSGHFIPFPCDRLHLHLPLGEHQPPSPLTIINVSSSPSQHHSSSSLSSFPLLFSPSPIPIDAAHFVGLSWESWWHLKPCCQSQPVSVMRRGAIGQLWLVTFRLPVLLPLMPMTKLPSISAATTLAVNTRCPL